MAKSLRSSAKKSNKAKLRSKVYEPVENSRANRLSQKLLAIAAQPKPDRAREEKHSANTRLNFSHQVDANEGTTRRTQDQSTLNASPPTMPMDIDKKNTTTRKYQRDLKSSKLRRHKAKIAAVFPVGHKSKRR